MTALPRLFPPTTKPLPEGARPTRELLNYVPQLPISERNRRWDKARKRMISAGFDALIFIGNPVFFGIGMANMRYMFQVESEAGATCLFMLQGEPVIWNGPPHTQRPTNAYLGLQEWVTDFRPTFGVPAIAQEVKDRGLDRSRIGLVAYSSPLLPTPTFFHQQIVDLNKFLPNAELADTTWLIQEMRMVKTEIEIDMLRQAGKISRKVIDAMVNTSRPGIPEAEVYAEMIRTQIANGAEPKIFNFFGSGPVEHDEQELWHTLHGCEQPLSPTMRPLQSGDLVIAEWHTTYGGYVCHTEYTVYLGKKPPKELQNIWDVSVECLEASKEALVAGRTIGEAMEMIRRPVKRAGLDYVELGFHAMGNASPEWPTVIYPDGFGYHACNGAGIEDYVLEEGMTFGNNIDLHDSRWKPDIGCMLSDFMVVRPGKAECLIDTPLEMGLVG